MGIFADALSYMAGYGLKAYLECRPFPRICGRPDDRQPVPIYVIAGSPGSPHATESSGISRQISVCF